MEQMLSLLKCSVLVGVAVLVLWALRPALGKRYQAKWRCALWLILAAALLLPLLPVPAPWTDAVTERAPIRIEVPQAPPIVLQSPAEPADTTPGPTPRPPAGDAVLPAPPLPSPAGGGAAGSQPVSQPVRVSLPTLLRTIWLAGMAVFALYYVLGTAFFYRRTLRWSRPAPEGLREQMEAAARSLGLRRTPALLVSGYVKSPMVIGLLRPRLVLPEEDYGPRELRFILRHELTHYRRGDLWFKLLLLIANGVHWFNPLSYLLVREAATDLELTCDDAVVAGADRETRRAYSETLLASLHRQSGAGVALSTHFYGGAKTMKERFQNILTGQGRKRGIAVLCAVLLLLAALGLGVAVTEQRSVPLTDAELAQWQEKLAQPGWAALLTHMYGSPEMLNLRYVLLYGAGIDHPLTDAERDDAHDAFFTRYDGRVGDAYTEAFGEPWENRIIGVTAADFDAYLREYTGLGFEDLSHAQQWNYLEEYDSYYALNTRTGDLQMEVVSGKRQGDTVRLTLRREQAEWNQTVCDQAGIPWEDAVLTVTGGKVESFANPLYAIAESAAAGFLQDNYGEDAQAALSQPLLLRMAYRAETGDYCEWTLNFRLTAEDGEPRYDSARMITCMKDNGDTKMVQATMGDQTLGEGYPSYIAMGYRFEDYIRYHYDYGLTLTARHQGWPALTDAFQDLYQAGEAEWIKDPQETAAQWILSCGDQLVSAETVYEQGVDEAPADETYAASVRADMASRDVLLRCTTAEGRQVLILLNRLNPQAGRAPGCWTVVGWETESGEDLPAAAEADYQSASVQIRYTANGQEWETTAYLLRGGTGYQGGAYTDYAYDVYIPRGWTRSIVHTPEGFGTYWYPVAAYPGHNFLRIAWSGHADADSFYQSYLPQYEETENNKRQLDSGDATAAWARGTQTVSGQKRYTESLWVDGAHGPFEVLWTSTDPSLMAEMRAAAMTFTQAGEDPPSFGEIEPVTLTGHFVYYPGYREVWQAEDTEWLQAGNYLVLTPSGWAFRVEDYFQENAERVRSLMNVPSSRYPAPFGDIRLDTLELAWTQDSGFPKEDDSLYTLFIYRADWSMYAADAPSYAGGSVDQNGWWHRDKPCYLVLEASYKKGCIQRSFLMSSDYEPGSEEFNRELNMVETGLGSSVYVTEIGIDNRIGVTEHDTHPAIFYDSTARELYAIHTSPALPDGG